MRLAWAVTVALVGAGAFVQGCQSDHCDAATTCAIACPAGMAASDVCKSGQRSCVCVPDKHNDLSAWPSDLADRPD